MKMFRLALILVLITTALTFAPPTLAQDDSSVIHCAPENAPLSPNDYAAFTVQRGDEVLPSLNFYRLSTVIEESGVCALSGWLVTNQYNQTPDFSQPAQFQLLVTAHEVIFSVTSAVLLDVFGLQASYYDQSGIVYRLEMTDSNALKIDQIITAVATLSVEEPEVFITFESKTE